MAINNQLFKSIQLLSSDVGGDTPVQIPQRNILDFGGKVMNINIVETVGLLTRCRTRDISNAINIYYL